ncbi:hypothetical protein DdX_12106 [Ditylenchus destructor]|uniref:Uncharacterized protein n=1 Tax=Ditylenchus destructor TaxID=166010 RepID=A0AAD4MXW8_9BILA|nr:hypothetical protein DdX_12106 [Ditylenchus destructor]
MMEIQNPLGAPFSHLGSGHVNRRDVSAEFILVCHLGSQDRDKSENLTIIPYSIEYPAAREVTATLINRNPHVIAFKIIDNGKNQYFTFEPSHGFVDAGESSEIMVICHKDPPSGYQIHVEYMESIVPVASAEVEFLAIIKAQLLQRFAGFRFILAANLADIISLLFYGIWAGLVILTKNVLLPLEWKDWLSVIMDTTWFVMYYMNVVLAFTRLMCVARPSKFREMGSTSCYGICFATWFISFLQTLFLHSTEWYTVLWYDPCCYGLAGDIYKNNSEGTATLFNILAAVVIPICIGCYVIAVGLLVANRRTYKKQLVPFGMFDRIFCSKPKVIAKKQYNAFLKQHQEMSSTEVRLILPCFLSSVLLLAIQMIMQFTFWRNWTGFILMVLYCILCGSPPLLRIAFSRRLRSKITNIFLPEKSGAVFSITQRHGSKM